MTSFVVEVIGVASLSNALASGRLRYNQRLPLNMGIPATWSIRDPIMDCNEDQLLSSPAPDARPRKASPSKVNIYRKRPASSARRVEQSSSDDSDVDDLPTIKRRNLQRNNGKEAAGTGSTSNVDTTASTDGEDSGQLVVDESSDQLDFVPLLLDENPYSADPYQEVKSKLMAHFPNDETTKDGEIDIAALNKKYGVQKHNCFLCSERKRSGKYLFRKRCIGITDANNRCVRWSHGHCVNAPVYLCRLEGCSTNNPNTAQKDQLKNMLVLYFELITRDLVEMRNAQAEANQKMLHGFITDLLEEFSVDDEF